MAATDIRLIQMYANVSPDGRDMEIVVARMAKLDAIAGTPRVGDWVVFDNGRGVSQRVSHVWPGHGVQTSAGGSYYLGDGYVSMSGSLDGIERFETLTPEDEIRSGMVWIFHHDWLRGHNRVAAEVPFRVWHCSSPQPR